MPVVPDTLKVGECYLTHSGLVRRVLDLSEGRVRYEQRRGRVREGHPWPRTQVIAVSVFAGKVERPVPCDWTIEPEG
jgi:hypothetical protein